MARGIVGEPGFRGLISRRAAAELKPALNENFRQKYVASGEIIPILLTAFDAELKPIAEAATERSGDVVWGNFWPVSRHEPALRASKSLPSSRWIRKAGRFTF